jgi:hypothetical protein
MEDQLIPVTVEFAVSQLTPIIPQAVPLTKVEVLPPSAVQIAIEVNCCKVEFVTEYIYLFN